MRSLVVRSLAATSVALALAALPALAEDAPKPATVTQANAAALTLTADRIVREGFLPNPHRQVDAIAARELLRVMIATGGATLSHTGRLHLDLTHAADEIRERLARVLEVEAACCEENSDEPAAQYLRDQGWTVNGNECFREPADTVSRYLAFAATA